MHLFLMMDPENIECRERNLDRPRPVQCAWGKPGSSSHEIALGVQSGATARNRTKQMKRWRIGTAQNMKLSSLPLGERGFYFNFRMCVDLRHFRTSRRPGR